MHPAHKKIQILRGEKISLVVPVRKSKILNINSLDIESGSCTFILGENGAGKSSLLSILGGWFAPTTGQLFWKNKQLQPVHERLVPGFESIELVHQNPKINSFWRVEEELERGLRHLTQIEKKRKKTYLVRLCHLGQLLQQSTDSLSGGEKRRLAIALALCKDIELLLMDEPFAELDYGNKMLLTRILLDLKTEGHITIVLVSHHGEDVHWLADKILVLHKGKIVEKLSRSTEGFLPQLVLSARLLGYKNLVAKSEFPHIQKFASTTDHKWIYIPETALGTSNRKESESWRLFRMVRQYMEGQHWNILWETEGLLVWSIQLEKHEGQDTAVLFVDISNCISMK